MEVQAVTRYARIAPEKAGHVSRVIQGKPVSDALAIVDLSPRKAARIIGKTLRSALANAENNHELKKDDLKVKLAVADPGPMLRRFRPKARGMAGRIRKRTSHIRIVLTDEE